MSPESLPLYTFSLDLLSRRDIPETLLLQKIQKKYPSSSHEEQQCVISRLKQERYIDDIRFIENFVRWRIEEFPRGKLVIVQELKQKMVDLCTINQVIDTLIPYEKEYEMCMNLVQKKVSLLNLSPPFDKKKKEKLVRFLASKGFSFDLIRDCIESMEEL